MTRRREYHEYPGLSRARDGLIVTVVDLDTGRVETFHRPGLVRGKLKINNLRTKRIPEKILVGVVDLVRAVADELDARDGRWRVRSFSSPTSILYDLRGRDPNHATYEADLLGRIDRLDLLETPVRSRKELKRLRVQILRARRRGLR